MCDVAPASAVHRHALALCHWIQEAAHGAAERCLTPPHAREFAEAMNDFRTAGMPAEAGGPDVGRQALWVIRELGLPAIVKACVSCRSARHHPTGKFRVNANGKLLDVWMLICCLQCGRTSKIPIHERIYVQGLHSGRLLMFENNDPALVRDLVMDGALGGKAGYQLDWRGTWELVTGMASCAPGREDPAPLTVMIRFELPAPIRVEKLLTTGLGLSRSAVRGMVGSGRILLPMTIGAKAREDFSFAVIRVPPREALAPASMTR